MIKKTKFLFAILTSTSFVLAGCNSGSSSSESDNNRDNSSSNPAVKISTSSGSSDVSIDEWETKGLKIDGQKVLSGNQDISFNRKETADGVTLESSPIIEGADTALISIKIMEQSDNQERQFIFGGNTDLLSFENRPSEEDTYFDNSDYDSMEVRINDGFIEIPFTVKDNGYSYFQGDKPIDVEVTTNSTYREDLDFEGDDQELCSSASEDDSDPNIIVEEDDDGGITDCYRTRYKSSTTEKTVNALFSKAEKTTQMAMAESATNHSEKILNLTEDKDVYRFFIDYVYAMGIISNEKKENMRNNFDPESVGSYHELKNQIDSIEKNLNEYQRGEISDEEFNSLTSDLMTIINNHGSYGTQKFKEIKEYYDQIISDINLEDQPIQFYENGNLYSRFIGNTSFGSLENKDGEEEFALNEEFSFMSRFLRTNPNTPMICQ